MMFNKDILRKLKMLNLHYEFLSLDDIAVLRTTSIREIEELDSECGFTLQEGTWYVVTIKKDGNPDFSEDVKQVLDICVPNVICSDKHGNRLLFILIAKI